MGKNLFHFHLYLIDSSFQAEKILFRPLRTGMEQSQDPSQSFDLGTWLGRKQAFGLMAGKCSAADAECLRHIRQHKLYRSLQMNWKQFCHERIGISQPVVDKIIRELEEFGPAYFHLAGVLRITAEEYRLIATSVDQDGVLCDGERIPITVENVARLTQAVETLRGRATLPAPEIPEYDVGRGIARVEKQLQSALAELGRLQAQSLDAGARMRLQSAAGSARDRLDQLLLGLRG
jgi:hypothetical protein